MNWIILLLLFGCCGNNGCRARGIGGDCGCADRGRRGNDRNSRGGRDCCDCDCARENARESARENAREAVREAREAVRDAKEAVREARAQGDCDGPGMIPPPWQDYPPMHRREADCDCD